MSSVKGRGQTTKGIWAACHKETRVFILDCEGTDSKERGEDRHRFEHTSSLFCLAMADVLLVNMWTQVRNNNFRKWDFIPLQTMEFLKSYLK